MHRRGLAINHRRPTLASRHPASRPFSPRSPLFVWSLFGRRGRDVGGGISRSVRVRPSSPSLPSRLINFSCPSVRRSPGSIEKREGREETHTTSERSSLPFAATAPWPAWRFLFSTPKAKNNGTEIRVETAQAILVSSPLWTWRGRPTTQGG